MISIQISTLVKFLAVFFLQFFSGCHDGLTYDEHGQVISAPVASDSLNLSNDSFNTSITSTPVIIPDTITTREDVKHSAIEKHLDTARINTKSITPEELLAFAEKQVGVRYRYGSINPKVGFDCSGFITYVFNHFDIKVPRSSVDFTHIGKPVPVEAARKGDLILFTGTNPAIRVVGHMGIIHSIDSNEIKFIHSSSGKANGVTITPLNGYYKSRFMTIRRVFPQNNFVKK